MGKLKLTHCASDKVGALKSFYLLGQLEMGNNGSFIERGIKKISDIE